MHTQRRYGTPSRPRQDHYTRWERPKGEPSLLVGTLLLAGCGLVAMLLLVAFTA